MIQTFQAHESLLSDCLQCLVAIDQDSMSRLRQREAVALAQVHEERYSSDEADEREFHHRKRFIMLDTVLARAGDFYKPCEIVSLDAARRT